MPIGVLPEGALAAAEAAVRDTFDVPVSVLPPLPEPAFAFNAARRQYGSVELLRRVAADAPAGAVRAVGLTAADLYIPALTFLFGQAVLNGKAAVVSVARLRQEFYGLPGDEPLMRERVRKEIVHELGHTFGLVHCPDRSCVMSLSTGIAQVDVKPAAFCEACRAAMLEGRAAALLADNGAGR